MPLPERGPSEAINHGEPAVPRPAASLILLRKPDASAPTGGGLEVLMLKRSGESHFMPNVWVFPGGSVDREDGEGPDGLRACARRELAEEAGIGLPEDAPLTTVARWVTPEPLKVRFDTWFFLGAAPDGTEATPDGFEMTEAMWIAPEEAVRAGKADEIAIAFPTLKLLEGLAEAADPETAIARAAADPGAERVILPKIVGDERHHRIILPHEDDYPA